MTTLFRIAPTPIDVCGMEDCISIRRQSEIHSWAQEDAVIAEQWCGVLAANNHLTLACSRRKVLEHLGYDFVEILLILLGFVGEHTFGAPPPNQLLGLPVVKVKPTLL